MNLTNIKKTFVLITFLMVVQLQFSATDNPLSKKKSLKNREKNENFYAKHPFYPLKIGMTYFQAKKAATEIKPEIYPTG